VHGALGFANRHAVIHDAGQVGIGESDAPIGSVAKNVAGARIAVGTEEEAGLRAEVGVPPAVQDNGCNVAVGIEAGLAKHGGKLVANQTLVSAEGSGYEFHSTSGSLLFDAEARFGEEDLHGQYSGLIGSDGGRIGAEGGDFAEGDGVADAFEPLTLREAETMEKLPITDSDVRHETGGAVKLGIRIFAGLRKIADYVLGGPTSAG